MTLFERLHMIIRCWRYRFKSEVHSINYVRSLNLKGSVMLDIGANKGIFSIYMSRSAGQNGKVIAFEAQPELKKYLSEVKQAFSLDNLEIIDTALSSNSAEMTLRRESIGSGAASFDFYSQSEKNIDSIKVDAITLDDFLQQRDDHQIDFIKCDVEGHEANVFYGAKNTLIQDMPILLFECHRSEEEKGELFSFLAEIGYTGFFYHVEPKDHASIFKRGAGKYIHYSEHAKYEYCRSSVEHRNYVFVKEGMHPDEKLN